MPNHPPVRLFQRANGQQSNIADPILSAPKTPSPPTNISASVSGYRDANGHDFDQATVTWTEPATYTDGSPVIDLGYYNAQYRVGAGAWSASQSTYVGSPTAFYVHLQPGQSVTWRVQSVCNSGLVSVWTSSVAYTMPVFPTPPLPPSAPALSTRTGDLIVSWDGNANNAAPYDTSWSRCDVHLATSSGFTPSPATLYGSITARGGSRTVAGLTYNQTYYAKLVAVDKTNLSSAGSNPSSGVAVAQISTADVSFTTGSGTKVSIGSTQPVGPAVGDIWYDGPANGYVMKSWNGSSWVSNQYGSGALGSGSVGSSQISSGAVGTAQISSGAVGTAQIANGAVNSTQLGNQAVATVNLANNAVTATQIANGTIGTTQISPTAGITGAQLSSTAGIAAGQVAFTARTIGGITTTYATTAPSSPVAGDIWYDTSNGYLLNRYSGSAWVTGPLGTNAHAAGSITGTILANNAVGTAQLAANAVTAAQLASGAVTATQLASGAVTAPAIASGAVGSSAIAGGAITSTQLAANAVTAAALASGAVGSAAIASGAITPTQLAANAVTSAAIAANAVGTAQIATGAVTSASIADGTIQVGDVGFTIRTLGGTSVTFASSAPTVPAPIAGDLWYDSSNGYRLNQYTGSVWTAYQYGTNAITAGAITANLIAANTITAAQIASGTITASQIAAGTITTTQIAAGTIAASNIASGTITATQLAANSVTATQLAANSVTSNAILAGTIVAADIATDTITATQIAAGAITSSELATNSVSANNIVSGTITATQIASGTITAANIASGTITATQISATAGITAGQIAAGTITATQISATANITGGQIAANTITAANIAAGSITVNQLNVVVGGGNLLANSSFENATNATTGFNPFGAGCTIQGSSAQSWVGSQSCLVTLPAVASSGIVCPLATPGPWRPNTQYTFSGYVYIPSGGLNPVLLTLQMSHTGGTVFVANVNTATLTAGNTNGWYRMSCTATTNAAPTGTGNLYIFYNGTPTAGWQFYTDGWQLEIGNLVTAYAPLTNEILPGTIVANQIAAGTIGAAQIAAGSITADRITVGGRGIGLCPNPSFEDPYINPSTGVTDNTTPASWTLSTVGAGSTAQRQVNTSIASIGNAMVALTTTGTGAGFSATANSAMIPVVAGTVYYCKVLFGGTVVSASGVYFQVHWYQANGSASAITGYTDMYGTGSGGALPQTQTNNSVLESLPAAPADAAYAQLTALYYNPPTAATLYVDSFDIQPANTGSLMVPGSIKAGIIDAGALYAMNINTGSLTAGTIQGSVGTSTVDSSVVTDTRYYMYDDDSSGAVLIYRRTGTLVFQTSTPGTGTWTVPAGVTSVKVECWGGGGGGQGSRIDGSTYGSGSGGAGGEYARENAWVVTPGANITYQVGAGGAGQAGTKAPTAQPGQAAGGTQTYFDTGHFADGSVAPGNSGGVIANGGGGGWGGFTIGGGSGSKNGVHFPGGQAGTGNYAFAGGGGGGSAGNAAPGNPGGNVAYGSATAGVAGAGIKANGGAGGAGGSGANGAAAPVLPTANGFGGGGGGGGSASGSGVVRNGGAGGPGRLYITYGGAITLVGSIAAAPATDPYGNAYQQGIKIYHPELIGDATTATGMVIQSYTNQNATICGSGAFTGPLTGWVIDPTSAVNNTIASVSGGVSTFNANADGGIYYIDFLVTWSASSGSGYRRIAAIYINGSEYQRTDFQANTAVLSQQVNVMYKAKQGDTVDFRVWHNAGVNVALNPLPYGNRFSITRVG